MRKLDRTDIGILLKAVENADIGTVQFAHETKPPVFYVYAVFLSANDLERNETERNILLGRAYDCCRTRFLKQGMTVSSLQEIHKIERRSHDPSV